MVNRLTTRVALLLAAVTVLHAQTRETAKKIPIKLNYLCDGTAAIGSAGCGGVVPLKTLDTQYDTVPDGFIVAIEFISAKCQFSQGPPLEDLELNIGLSKATSLAGPVEWPINSPEMAPLYLTLVRTGSRTLRVPSLDNYALNQPVVLYGQAGDKLWVMFWTFFKGPSTASGKMTCAATLNGYMARARSPNRGQ